MKPITSVIRRVLCALRKEEEHPEPLKTYSHQGTLISKHYRRK